MSYKGLQQYCYQVGFEQAHFQKPDPVGEAIAAAPCTLTADANKAYAQGIVDGMNPVVKEAFGIKDTPK